MSVRVSVEEAYRAAPVLNKIFQARLSTIGSMKLTQLMSTVDEQLDAVEKERMAKLRTLVVLNEDGTIKSHDETDENGKTVQRPEFLTPEADKEMQAFAKGIAGRAVVVPFRIKAKHLAPVAGFPGSGYPLSPLECRILGRFLSYDDLPKEPDEDIEETE